MKKEGKLKDPIVILRDIFCGLEVVDAVKPYFRCYLDTNDETKFIEIFYTFPDSNVIYSYSLSKDMLIGKFEDVIRDRVTHLKTFVDKHKDDLKEISVTYNSGDEEAVLEIVIKSKGDFTYSRIELDPNYDPQNGLGVVEEDDEDFYKQEEPKEQIDTVKEENKSCIFTSKEQDDIFKFHMAVEEFDKIIEKLSMHKYNGTKLEDEFRHSTLFRSLIPKINSTTLTLIVYHAINKMIVLSEDVVTIIRDKELMTEEELNPLYDYYSNIIDHFTLYVETCDLYYDNLIHFMVTRGPVRNVAKDIVDDIIKKYIKGE